MIYGVLALACAFGSAAPLAAQQDSPAPAAVRIVTDEMGRAVRVPLEVRRIVSLAPNMTETIYALGAQDRLVGVSSYCDWPAEAQQKAKVGGTTNPSIEQIVALKPDLVLAAKTANRLETVEALERLGIPVWTNNPQTVDDVFSSTRRIAELIGADAAGDALVEKLRVRLADLRSRLEGRPPKTVLFVVWHDPLITIGRNTFLADAVRTAGATLAVDLEQDWPRLSLEEVVRVQPEYLVFAASHSQEIKPTLEDLRTRPGWRSLNAVRDARAAVISDAVNRPAPRLIDAIEELARQLHPEAFAEEKENKKRKIENGRPLRSSTFLPNFQFPSSSFR